MNYFIMLIFVMLMLFNRENINTKINFPKTIENVKEIPDKDDVWIFILAGQSNMAGRGFVQPQDTIQNNRILSINNDNDLVYAKEPLHYYEPTMTGLDCGLSFAHELIKNIPDSISELLVPTAVGGSSIIKWLNDCEHRGVKLLTNFKEKMNIAQQFGKIKGVLWHQGESDANENGIKYYLNNLDSLMNNFRAIVDYKNIPIIIGQLGNFQNNLDNDKWQIINSKIEQYVNSDENSFIIQTNDLNDIGDNVHFNSASQRKLGKRFAKQYLKLLQ